MRNIHDISSKIKKFNIKDVALGGVNYSLKK